MKPISIWDRLKELDRFFQGRDAVHKTMRRVVKRLEKANIPYVVVGGMAVYYQGHRQATGDVDILITKEGLAEFRKRFVPKHYELCPGRSRRYVDRTSEVPVDILATGCFPGIENRDRLLFRTRRQWES